MDCFVASLLAMKSLQFSNDFAFPRRVSPELCRNYSPNETEGVGNAGRSMHPQPRV